MSDVKVLDIFYNKIVPEAGKGKIDCYFMINVAFDTAIDNAEVSRCVGNSEDGIIVPTLKITNKDLFDKLLAEYVRKALEFYDSINFSFLEDLNSEHCDNLEQIKEEYLIKYIIVVTLFANASYNDFMHPIEFLSSRTAMFDNKIIESEEVVDLGYISSIEARLFAIEEKSPIKAETPYRIRSYLEFDDGYHLSMPEIYVGNAGNKYQLYGIQKTSKSNELEERKYLKQIRKGLIAKINGAPEHYFLAIMLFISLCSDKEIEIIPFLIERWNAKRMAMFNKTKLNQYLALLGGDGKQYKSQEDMSEILSNYFEKLEIEHDKLQSNIKDNLLRYFTKLGDVTIGLNFCTIPFETDTNSKIRIAEYIESRSMAFNEVFKLVDDYKKRSSHLGR